jgi:hypothetical protein
LFGKLDRTGAVVADVSMISSLQEKRRSPNPNVLVEVGYAGRALGWQSVVFVFNSAFGKIEDLPFDIRHRRVLAYDLPSGANVAARAAARQLLRAGLRETLRLLVLARPVPIRELRAAIAEREAELARAGTGPCSVDQKEGQLTPIERLNSDLELLRRLVREREEDCEVVSRFLRDRPGQSFYPGAIAQGLGREGNKRGKIAMKIVCDDLEEQGLAKKLEREFGLQYTTSVRA